VVNQDDDHISGFSINSNTGALTPLTGTVATDDAPVELSFHASGHFAYAANFNSGDVTVYRVESTGALGLLGATPVALSLSSIGMHPSGKFAYVTSLASNQVTTFAIDQATGGLTPLTPRVTSGDGPTSVTLDSQGRFAYVTNAIEGTVSVFAIDAVSGTLTPLSTVPAGTNPVALTLDASGRFAYVANLGSDNVTLFTVNSTTGALSPAGPAVNTGTGPAWVVLR
jgi:6-phosphogluconolactonase (cycloisomerase 2 family)